MDRIVCKIFEQIREADGCLFGDSIDCVFKRDEVVWRV